jgi:hypothetical protein
MSITITDEMVDVAMAAGLGPRSPFVFDPVYVGFDLRAALSAAAPLIEAAVRERCAAEQARVDAWLEEIWCQASDPYDANSVDGRLSRRLADAIRMMQRTTLSVEEGWTKLTIYPKRPAAIRADGGAE